jgi:hypothetical protein
MQQTLSGKLLHLRNPMSRHPERDVLVPAAKLPRRAVVVVGAGHNPNVDVQNEIPVDRPVIRDRCDPAVRLYGRVGLPL